MNYAVSQWYHEHGFDLSDLNKANSDNEYAVILASRQAREDVLQHLIEQDVDINILDHYGNNALWAACYAFSETCCRLLIANGCSIDHQNVTGNTALGYVASSGKDSIVKLLLALGANPTLQNQDDMTAIDLATSLVSLKLLRTATRA